MVLFVMLLKAAVWFLAFWYGMRSNRNLMLATAGLAAIVLTVMDKFSVAFNLGVMPIVLTLVLYLLMSFLLLPIAWKVRDTTVTFLCNILGMVGAFAGVNFTMDLVRGLHPFMNK
jgi:hypothetical protein